MQRAVPLKAAPALGMAPSCTPRPLTRVSDMLDLTREERDCIPKA